MIDTSLDLPMLDVPVPLMMEQTAEVLHFFDTFFESSTKRKRKRKKDTGKIWKGERKRKRKNMKENDRKRKKIKEHEIK